MAVQPDDSRSSATASEVEVAFHRVVENHWALRRQVAHVSHPHTFAARGVHYSHESKLCRSHLPRPVSTRVLYKPLWTTDVPWYNRSKGMLLGPRDFAGRKSALVADFARAFTAALNDKPDDVAARDRVLALLQEGPRQGQEGRGPKVLDLGGLMKTQRAAFETVLVAADADPTWLETWEDLLEFEFPVPRVQTKPVLKRTGGNLEPTFQKEAARRVGCEMEADGTLSGFVLTASDFPDLETVNPQVETLCEVPDVRYILDRTINKAVALTGSCTVDVTLRRHMGKQLRGLFPKLPDRGIVKGKDRKWTEMLKWRSQNPRKKLMREAVRTPPRIRLFFPRKGSSPTFGSSIPSVAGLLHEEVQHGARRLLRGGDRPRGAGELPAHAGLHA